MNIRLRSVVLLAFIILLTGCANQTTPTGGKKDITPPKLLSVSPVDSLRNTTVKKIELEFDEYITVADAIKEVQISPILAIQPTVVGYGKKVTVKIVDSLLEPNTTYRISFGNAIRDLHENNAFPNYTYTFSTGAYFDSLALAGKVLNAATGLADSAGIIVVLYNASENDSVVVRKKPKYIAKVDANGRFLFKGLPKRSFKIYAIKDANDNLYYDGATEAIAFNDLPVLPDDTTRGDITLRIYQEPDTNGVIAKETPRLGKGERGKEGSAAAPAFDPKGTFTYTVAVDTSNATRRTLDITKPISIAFNHLPTINRSKVTLFIDTGAAAVAQDVDFKVDTAHPELLLLHTDWKENTLYTLKLAKGFVKDSAGTEPVPSKYIFRTKEDADYGKITINLPARYHNNKHLLQVTKEKDTVYQKLIADTSIVLKNLSPGKYDFRVIEDRNGNGKWDQGNLFMKLQPELVIPYSGNITLRPGFDYIVDFDQNLKAKR